MNLLIVSDFGTNSIYNELEVSSIGYYSDLNLSEQDYQIINSDTSNTTILSLITDNNGLSKLFFAKVSTIDLVNDNYKLSYSVDYIISDKDDIANFNRAFPYAFKSQRDAKLSRSKELIKIAKFFVGDNRVPNRVSINDAKSLIINSDAFRLQSAKAEVFKKDASFGVHTRLSHSIRITHIANTIAKRLEAKYGIKIKYDLIENVSMSLNMGHTPFGNVGEKIINNILKGKIDIIPNSDKLNLKYFRHSLQSARMLERIDPVCSENSKYIDLDIIAGIFAHTRLNFDDDIIFDEDAINKFFYDYYINHEAFVGNYIKLNGNDVIPRTLEAQIVTLADEIAQKSYDVELAVRSDAVDDEEIVTRLMLLSEVTGEYFKYNFENRNELYYSSRAISDYIVNYLVKSVCNSFRFEVYRSNDKEIEKYIGFSETGKIVLDVIDNYFQSKLLLSRNVRLFDHKAKQMILDIFRELYNDINLLPTFHKNLIIEEFRKSGIKDLNILLCFISYNDGVRYLETILYSDVNAVKNKHDQKLLIRKREIIIQAIIDYITLLCDNDAEKLHYDLMHD